MLKKLAIKRLRPSDLGFFNSYLSRGLTQSKQKGFNLDKAVLEGAFFPSLTAILEPKLKKALHLDLHMGGPGIRAAETLSRKIKIEAKNFRLNGEVINNPLSEPTRYDTLADGDFALMEFTGQAEPTAVRVLLLSAAEPADRKLHAAFNRRFPDGSMHVLATDVIAEVVSEASPPPSHPVRDWLDDDLLEEVAAGAAEAIQRLNRRRGPRGLTYEELQEAKAAAQATGLRGETLTNNFLASGGLSDVTDFEWTSSANAIAPFDFCLTAAGIDRVLDVKSTSGPFESPFHLSLAEIREACLGQRPYDLFRAFKVTQEGGILRVARDIRSLLLPLLRSLEALPAGVVVDSLSFSPSFFTFEEREYPLDSEESEL